MTEDYNPFLQGALQLYFCGLHSLSAAIFHHRIVTCAACRGQLWPPYQSAGPAEHMGAVGIQPNQCLATI